MIRQVPSLKKCGARLSLEVSVVSQSLPNQSVPCIAAVCARPLPPAFHSRDRRDPKCAAASLPRSVRAVAARRPTRRCVRVSDAATWESHRWPSRVRFRLDCGGEPTPTFGDECRLDMQERGPSRHRRSARQCKSLLSLRRLVATTSSFSRSRRLSCGLR